MLSHKDNDFARNFADQLRNVDRLFGDEAFYRFSLYNTGD